MITNSYDFFLIFSRFQSSNYNHCFDRINAFYNYSSITFYNLISEKNEFIFHNLFTYKILSQLKIIFIIYSNKNTFLIKYWLHWLPLIRHTTKLNDLIRQLRCQKVLFIILVIIYQMDASMDVNYIQWLYHVEHICIDGTRTKIGWFHIVYSLNNIWMNT